MMKFFPFKLFFLFTVLLSLHGYLMAQNSSFEIQLSELRPNNILKFINLTTGQLNTRMKDYKKIVQEFYTKKESDLIAEINKLRHPYYQYRTYLAAKKLEGINIYHNYGDGEQNDETNTCVSGWCLVMAETGMPYLYTLASGQVQLFPKTLEKEKEKAKPNLFQKLPTLLNVDEVLSIAENMGFYPIDTDLAQRGDFLVQYYRKQRIKNEFAAQHISIVDMVIPYGNGVIELRDWHEGIDNEPYIYRTGYNMKSSFNNILTAENIYFGYQNEQGKERILYGRNPNIYQGYAYFGENIKKAANLIQQLNFIRNQLSLISKIQWEDYLKKYIKSE